MSEKNDKELYLNFDEYIRQGEPSQREAAYAWSTAIVTRIKRLVRLTMMTNRRLTKPRRTSSAYSR